MSGSNWELLKAFKRSLRVRLPSSSAESPILDETELLAEVVTSDVIDIFTSLCKYSFFS